MKLSINIIFCTILSIGILGVSNLSAYTPMLKTVVKTMLEKSSDTKYVVNDDFLNNIVIVKATLEKEKDNYLRFQIKNISYQESLDKKAFKAMSDLFNPKASRHYTLDKLSNNINISYLVDLPIDIFINSTPKNNDVLYEMILYFDGKTVKNIGYVERKGRKDVNYHLERSLIDSILLKEYPLDYKFNKNRVK